MSSILPIFRYQNEECISRTHIEARSGKESKHKKKAPVKKNIFNPDQVSACPASSGVSTKMSMNKMIKHRPERWSVAFTHRVHARGTRGEGGVHISSLLLFTLSVHVTAYLTI